ncbi:MAG: LTA synthase family protein [Desulfovibrionaceae bacterium]|nr:LTA synthase family protein [Desulfovibrionaceae bacterium]
MWVTFFCLLISIIYVILLQRLASGHPIIKKLWPDVVAGYVGAFFFASFALLSARPYVALLLTIMSVGILFLTNHAKRLALRNEPLLFADINLAWQVAHFPWLYLPFLPYKTVLWVLGICAPLFIWLILATHATYSLWLILLLCPFFAVLLALKMPRLALIIRKILAHFPLEFSAKDTVTYGPLGAAILHGLWHTFERGKSLGIKASTSTPYAPVSYSETIFQDIRTRVTKKSLQDLPHVLLIQEESFCDPRSYAEGIPKDFLSNFDSLKAACLGLNLGVRAYGAYTMRTEYEVLTGIEATYLGTDAFHPYWSAAKITSWSLAHYLASLGYMTVCVHPFARSFFYRDKALPRLGFERFISLENFPNPRTFGPYISDGCVADCILEIFKAAERPIFCFAITMENHGPWLPGRFKGAELRQVIDLQDLDPKVNRYLTHLRNCDAMLGELQRGLSSLGRKTIFSLYGDHLPGLKMLIPQDARDTPCLIWASQRELALGLKDKYGNRSVLKPAELGGVLLEGVLLSLKGSNICQGTYTTSVN